MKLKNHREASIFNISIKFISLKDAYKHILDREGALVNTFET